jgi:hypothetical protein
LFQLIQGTVARFDGEKPNDEAVGRFELDAEDEPKTI